FFKLTAKVFIDKKEKPGLSNGYNLIMKAPFTFLRTVNLFVPQIPQNKSRMPVYRAFCYYFAEFAEQMHEHSEGM
ncbi:MAG: hypothetical protein J6B66_04710, partial [Anaerotignum sp.]|nr:hypothetical protein [Anaerotignum sp.]